MGGFLKRCMLDLWANRRSGSLREPRAGCQANSGVPFDFEDSACLSRGIMERLDRSRTAQIALSSFSAAFCVPKT
jgi:hypothetical protein